MLVANGFAEGDTHSYRPTHAMCWASDGGEVVRVASPAQCPLPRAAWASVAATEHFPQRWERVALRHDKLAVLVRQVPFDIPLRAARGARIVR